MTTETDVTSDLMRKIRGWIEMETPSHDQAAVAGLMKLVATDAQASGLTADLREVSASNLLCFSGEDGGRGLAPIDDLEVLGRKHQRVPGGGCDLLSRGRQAVVV